MPGSAGSPAGDITPRPFSAERSDEEGRVVVTLTGELDMATVGQLSAATADVPAGGSLLIDMAELDFMDSSGLRVLMNLDVRSREEGWSLAVARPRPAVTRLLEISNVHKRIPVLDSPA